MRSLSFGFVFILLILSSNSFAVDSSAMLLEKMKQELPEKALTLDLILSYALQKSDSFKIVAAESISKLAPALNAEAAFDTRLSLSRTWLRDGTESSNVISPNETNSDAYAFGISKYFSTGTGLNFELTRGYNEIGFPPGAFFQIEPYYETRASVGLTQNLWADTFGYSSRRILKAAELASKAQGVNFEANVENWALGMIDSYYSAWYSQAQAAAARSSLQRRERLLKVGKLRLKRGTTETPDYLQIESAYLMSKAQKLEADRNLSDQWRKLIILLGLPREWLSIDPIDVPLKIDDIIPEAQQICRQFESKSLTPKTPASQKKADLLAESAKLRLESAKNELWPDLELQGKYFFNGINAVSEESIDELIARDHPGWSLSLVLTTPIEFSAQKAQLALAAAEKIQADALKTTARDEKELDWHNECANLKRLKETVEGAELTFKNQSRRARLEEKDFQIGRATTFDIIQAGDDATQAEIFLRGTQVQLRSSAWKILTLNSMIAKKLEAFAKKYGGEFKLE